MSRGQRVCAPAYNPIHGAVGISSVYSHSYNTARSRSVTIPNLGGYAGISFNFPNAKVRFGYRADFFFGARDSGLESHTTTDVGFHGPFATISIGLGG